MSDEAAHPGQVSATPEGGPIDQGVPGNAPGTGQVQSTPEAAPLAEDDELVPPTWREHMKGPILGMDDAAPSPSAATPPAAAREEPRPAESTSLPTAAASIGFGEDASGMGQASSRSRSDEELRKWPPYSGKPVSEVRWDALKYAAPLVAQAEKLTIKAIDLSGHGLSKLARYLETRRQEREAKHQQPRDRASDR